MLFFYLLSFFCLGIFYSCSPGQSPSNDFARQGFSSLSESQKSLIGRKIWQNECAGSVDGLTTWNVGEEFPSLGIGHFIWYPTGIQGKFEESWPSFVSFALRSGKKPPEIAFLSDSPWRSRSEFQAKFRSAEMEELRRWLADNVGVQTDFIISRSRAALPKILAAAPASERKRIHHNYQKVAACAQGTYALIDYVNFKGDGTQASEKYAGRGWGLLQVLGGMREVPAGDAAASEFAASAKRALHLRIQNSPPERGEMRWKEGWSKRCDTYGRPL